MIELAARLTVEPAEATVPGDFTARCELHNVGDEEAAINAAPLSSPSLALEVVDAAGELVLLPPPPVPPAVPPVERLGVGEVRVAEFPGFLPAWTPPGRYRVRFRYLGSGPGLFAGLIVSTAVEFTLRA
ncbi:MAG TPA: hypothetical protein PLX85_03285 [Dehalococcoidia bacterium]|nr:hypothetical protein [Dehalococcoidia bacterium]